MEWIGNKKIETLLDAWKHVFSWKTLGFGYLRCLLVFTEDILIEFEMNRTEKFLPFKRGSYGNDPLSNIFWGIIDTLFHEVVGYSDKLNKLFYSDKLNKLFEINDLENKLKSNKIKYKINSIIAYYEINQIKIKESAKISIKRDDFKISLEILYNNKKFKYEAYIPEKSIYMNIKSKLIELLGNKIIIS
jgi:hypothetical protein